MGSDVSSVAPDTQLPSSPAHSTSHFNLWGSDDYIMKLKPWDWYFSPSNMKNRVLLIRQQYWNT
jgi:hypothetical protein